MKTKDKILDELLRLPDGAWMSEDNIKNGDPAFKNCYETLVAKRKYLEKLLEFNQ